jgi:hypothetical protein
MLQQIEGEFREQKETALQQKRTMKRVLMLSLAVVTMGACVSGAGLQPACYEHVDFRELAMWYLVTCLGLCLTRTCS